MNIIAVSQLNPEKILCDNKIMPLPDFEELKSLLASAKREDQSWGDFFREARSGQTPINCDSFNENKNFTLKPSLFETLSTWDFYSSPSLDAAAADYDVKSWQLTEYIEAIRDGLFIGESDLVVYDKSDSIRRNQIRRHDEPAISSSHLDVSMRASAHQDQDKKEPEHFLQQTIPPEPSQIAHSLGTSQIRIALILALVVMMIIFIARIVNQKSPSYPSALSSPNPSGIPDHANSTTVSKRGARNSANDQVYFTGIDLPITNKICNKKKSICIYNLASLVTNESGEAAYSYSEMVNGQPVFIKGNITITNIDRNGKDRSFTFAFRDDLSNTTPGWAAAGYFSLDQDSDPAKPGILTRFKTTESYGPKTPVGLENTSYLYPR